MSIEYSSYDSLISDVETVYFRRLARLERDQSYYDILWEAINRCENQKTPLMILFKSDVNPNEYSLYYIKPALDKEGKTVVDFPGVFNRLAIITSLDGKYYYKNITYREYTSNYYVMKLPLCQMDVDNNTKKRISITLTIEEDEWVTKNVEFFNKDDYESTDEYNRAIQLEKDKIVAVFGINNITDFTTDNIMHYFSNGIKITKEVAVCDHDFISKYTSKEKMILQDYIIKSHDETINITNFTTYKINVKAIITVLVNETPVEIYMRLVYPSYTNNYKTFEIGVYGIPITQYCLYKDYYRKDDEFYLNLDYSNGFTDSNDNNMKFKLVNVKVIFLSSRVLSPIHVDPRRIILKDLHDNDLEVIGKGSACSRKTTNGKYYIEYVTGEVLDDVDSYCQFQSLYTASNEFNKGYNTDNKIFMKKINNVYVQFDNQINFRWYTLDDSSNEKEVSARILNSSINNEYVNVKSDSEIGFIREYSLSVDDETTSPTGRGDPNKIFCKLTQKNCFYNETFNRYPDIWQLNMTIDNAMQYNISNKLELDRLGVAFFDKNDYYCTLKKYDYVLSDCSKDKMKLIIDPSNPYIPILNVDDNGNYIPIDKGFSLTHCNKKYLPIGFDDLEGVEQITSKNVNDYVNDENIANKILIIQVGLKNVDATPTMTYFDEDVSYNEYRYINIVIDGSGLEESKSITGRKLSTLRVFTKINDSDCYYIYSFVGFENDTLTLYSSNNYNVAFIDKTMIHEKSDFLNPYPFIPPNGKLYKLGKDAMTLIYRTARGNRLDANDFYSSSNLDNENDNEYNIMAVYTRNTPKSSGQISLYRSSYGNDQDYTDDNGINQNYIDDTYTESMLNALKAHFPETSYSFVPIKQYDYYETNDIVIDVPFRMLFITYSVDSRVFYVLYELTDSDAVGNIVTARVKRISIFDFKNSQLEEISCINCLIYFRLVPGLNMYKIYNYNHEVESESNDENSPGSNLVFYLHIEKDRDCYCCTYLEYLDMYYNHVDTVKNKRIYSIIFIYDKKDSKT